MFRDSTTVTPAGERSAVATMAAAMSLAATGRHVAGAKTQEVPAQSFERPRFGAITGNDGGPEHGEARPLHGPQPLLHFAFDARIEEGRRAARAECAHDREVARAVHARELREPQRVLEIHPPEPGLRPGLADRRAEGAEDVVAVQAPAQSAELVEFGDRLPHFRVPRGVAEIAPRHDDDAAVFVGGNQPLETLAANEARGACENCRQSTHCELTVVQTLGR